MLRVVPDTNILVSGLIFGGLPETFIELAFSGSFLLFTSPALLNELDGTLRTKFHVSDQEAQATRTRLEMGCQIVVPDLILTVVKKDPDDDRVMECAVTARADSIVSGDRHLLSLGSYQGIAIVTVRQFMDALP